MSPSHPDWRRDLRPRLAAHWPLKAVGIPVFVTVFFLVYFRLLRQPAFAVTVMPFTALDRAIGFWPAALLPYGSLWVYAFLATILLRGRRELVPYGVGVAFISGVGLGIFYLWPSAVDSPAGGWTNDPAWALLKKVDAAGNACPSLHVAFAVFTAVWLERLFRAAGVPGGARLLNAVWAAIITASTLATKQHVAVDVLAGVALGLCGALPGPRAPVGPSAAPSMWNRLNLALAASIAAKLTILVLGIEWSHPGWAVVIFVAPDLWIVGGLLLPNSAAVMPLATHFRTPRREVWLTIDDGPEPATQPAMLDLLDRHRARATFFLIGEKARARPALVAEIVRRGHTLGNHTQTHPLATFWRAGPRRTAREVEDCDAALRAAGAGPSPWFRAPAGVKNLALRRALDQRQRVLVGWSARGLEVCSASPEVSLRRLTKRLAPGAILLMHESDRHAADRIALLSLLLEHLSAAGYTCVLPVRSDLW